jgi:hypothetical protein
MAKRASPTDVIDLTENDDENAEEEYGNATVRSLRRRLSRIPAAVAVAASALHRPASNRVKRERMGDENSRENLVTGDDDATRDRKPAAKTTTMDQEEEVDVEVLEAPAPRNVPTAATAVARNSNSDEIEVVGTLNQVLLPHMRQHCTEEPFLPFIGGGMQRLANNVKVCSLCYCYVCNVEASKCPTWNEHCSATDSGPSANRWIAERNACRQKNKQAVDRELPTPAATGIHQEFAGAGPFPPDTAGASGPNTILTKCRKCGWFNKFAHKDFKFDQDVTKGIQRGRTVPRWYHFENSNRISQILDDEIHPTGYMDWCHACGCVASERDLSKIQSKSYVPSQ